MEKEKPVIRILCEASGHRIIIFACVPFVNTSSIHPSVPCCFRPVNRRFAPRYNSLWLPSWLTSNWRVNRLRSRLAFLLGVTTDYSISLYITKISRKYGSVLARKKSLAHTKLFIAANICVKQAQNRGIRRRTGPSESLSMWFESSLLRQIQTAAVFRVVNCFTELFFSRSFTNKLSLGTNFY